MMEFHVNASIVGTNLNRRENFTALTKYQLVILTMKDKKQYLTVDSWVNRGLSPFTRAAWSEVAISHSLLYEFSGSFTVVR